MDSNTNKQALYEIYRACRLCGGSAGYKMPIVQNIIPMNDVEFNLQQKIKDCVNIEVSLNDRMPPLICEPCITKVNKFYNFLQLCKRTNENTRLRLGLPLNTASKEVVENENSSKAKEQISINGQSNSGESLQKNKKLKKATETKETEVVKIEKDGLAQTSRSSLSNKSSSAPKRPSRTAVTLPREKTPPRSTRVKPLDTDDMALSKLIDRPPPKLTRQTAPDVNDDISLSKLMEQSKKTKPPPKPIVKKENITVKKEDVPRSLKRYSRELHQLLSTPAVKKMRVSNTPSPKPSPKQSSRTIKKQSPQISMSEKPNIVSKSSNTTVKLIPQRRETQNEVKTLAEASIPQKKPHQVQERRFPSRTTKHSRKQLKRSRKQFKWPMIEPKNSVSEPNPPVSETKTSASETISPVSETNPPGKGTASPLVCVVCDITFKGLRNIANHMRYHIVSYTPSNKACNACRDWFVNVSEAQRHHSEHSDKDIPYRCMLCSTDFSTNDSYEEHITKKECRASTEMPDVKCKRCWKYFPTVPMLEAHKCWGEGDRPAMCIICKETVSARNLKRHEKICTPKKGILDSALVDQDILDRLKPMQVRVARCDPLLKLTEQGHFNVARVRDPYGLDRYFFYPYVTIKPKTKIASETNTPHMMKINDEIKTEFDYVHWDSDDDDYSTVSNLKCLCLKAIYSNKLLGKAPKRLRNATQGFDDNNDLSVNIDGLINRVNDDGRIKDNRDTDVDSPKLGGVTRYSSPWNCSEDYNSDSIITDVFRGFSSKSNNHSNDSQSLVSNTIKDLIQSNQTDDDVITEGNNEKKIKDLDTCEDDVTNSKEYNEKEQTNRLDTTECSSNNNGSSFNDLVNVKPNTGTNSIDEIEIITENASQVSFSKDLDSFVDLKENFVQNIDANVKTINETTDMLESNENSQNIESNSDVMLEVNQENSLCNREYKEDFTTSNDATIKTAVNDNGGTNEGMCANDNEGLRVSVDKGKNTIEMNSIENIKDNVCDKLEIKKHFDTVYEDRQFVNEDIREVNKSDTLENTDNLKQNCESVGSVKENIGYSDLCLSENVETASFNANLDNKNIDNSVDIFKMINEQIAIINQKQAIMTQETNVSEFSISNNDDYKSNNVCSDLRESTECNDRVNYVSDNNDILYHNDNLHHKSAVDSVENVGVPLNDFNKHSLNVKVDNDKVVEDDMCLNNPLQMKNSELDGMDLDNISDEDFDFE